MNSDIFYNDKTEKNDALRQFLLGYFDPSQDINNPMKKAEVSTNMLESMKPCERAAPIVAPSAPTEWMTSVEVMQLLKISKRSLQNYRDRGIISYERLRGKFLYNRKKIDDYLVSKKMKTKK